MAAAIREATAPPGPAPTPEKPPAAPGLPDLDVQVEALVLRYTCGAVIDAAWAASAHLFKPQGGRA